MAHKILVAVDGTDESERALEYAAKMAREMEDAHLTIFSVGEPVPNDFIEHDKLPEGETEREQLEKLWEGSDRFHAEHEQVRDKMFKRMVRRAEKLGMEPDHIDTKYASREVSIPAEIVNEAEEGAYEAICLGKHAHTGLKELFHGSITDRVKRQAKDCAVWVVE
ncbi:MAG: hypothetical protein C0617_00620 [Desulfuromonas sp.]|uniref:universal stress protein n=1 Tax=Desulfuromonas sp. TaxID=892 RepID=UPI000CB74510|nr:universal stress protein [Desulfuromonas sp.]PLX86609.1 MAG: hypothetical protein C0617_00620 [Desulfuromonas sp.]